MCCMFITLKKFVYSKNAELVASYLQKLKPILQIECKGCAIKRRQIRREKARMHSELQELAVQLFDAGAVRFGDIEAKVGRRTPVYFDLRVVVSHPRIMMSLSCELLKMASEIPHDLLCGVPYAALPFAAVMSVTSNTPMIMKRKETKLYATKKLVEGVFNPGQNCLVVEDVVTSGGSLLETVDALLNEGLKVTHAVVVLDRGQGGASVLKANGVQIRSLFTLAELVEMLKLAEKISNETEQMILQHIHECQFGVKDNLD